MPKNVPVSIWRIPNRTAELGSDGELPITTQAGDILLTQNGDIIVTQPGTEFAEPASTWATVEITPASQWRTTLGNTDSDTTGVYFIVDTVGDFLVDPQGNFVIDTGLIMDNTPDSIWSEDDSI